MNLMLQKTSAVGVQEGASDKIYAYPYPFVDQLSVCFKLSQDVENASIGLFSQYGVNIANYSIGDIAKGKHSVSLMPSVSPGMYMLRLQTSKELFKTIIVKKK